MHRIVGRPSLADVLLALALTVAGQVEAWTADVEDGSRVATAGCTLVATSALALRRRSPSAVALVVLGALVVKAAVGGSGDAVVLLASGVLAVFTVGASEPSPRSERTLVALLALAVVAFVVTGDEPVGELVFSGLAVGGPWVAGRLLREHAARAAMLEELAERREREADDQLRMAASRERARIARELHDLVGHAVSVMVLQAGAAEGVVRKRPDEAARSLASIQSTGREAIDELRRVLGLLRTDGDPRTLTPLPGMSELDALIERFREGGVDVTLDVDGDPATLPPGVSLAAFRIVQEALTNVARHASAGTARVTVRYGARTLDLEVVDDGAVPSHANGSGFGLLGMRERVALYGGHLDVGPRPEGGYRVAAVLPLAHDLA